VFYEIERIEWKTKQGNDADNKKNGPQPLSNKKRYDPVYCIFFEGISYALSHITH
jgi:hypothetical protein